MNANTEKHPCYSKDAHHKYARMHLPVAPKCNISCNYCNRKFDCVNESRPGVTSEILNPEGALRKFQMVKEKVENLSVVGIAGPGDALANWQATRRSIELIRAADPNVIFCLSTNGLMLPEYAQEIIELGIQHVTVTVNCIDSEIGKKIYKFVSYKGVKYQGSEGAQLLLNNQLEGIKELAKNNVLVKVNIVMIKGINETHIPEVVRKVKELGAFITNIMPLIPAPGSVFENFPQTSAKEIDKLRNLCELDLQQMRHCKQCRADAIGMLGNDRSAEFRGCQGKKEPCSTPTLNKTYKIAVASKHGIMVDQHFGYASEFLIYEGNGQDFQQVEKRNVEKYCNGSEDCDEEGGIKESVVEALTDCQAVLTMRIGYHAKERLLKKDIQSVEYCNDIEAGLLYVIKKLNENKCEKEAV